MAQRSVLITGGAIGIGAACGEAFCAAGYRVVIADVLDAEGLAHVQSLTSLGYSAEYVRMDVSSVDDVEKAVRTTQGDGFNTVIANAGIAKRVMFERLDDAAWQRTIDVNLTGAMRVFRAGIPMMIQKGGGSLIALSSISGVAYGWSEHAHYSASKAGIIGLVRALAVEYGNKHIRANAIAPGFIRTAQSLDEEHSMGAAGLESAVHAIPLGRVGDPADVADVALFMASDASRYITGQVLVVDGGLLVRQS